MNRAAPTNQPTHLPAILPDQIAELDEIAARCSEVMETPAGHFSQAVAAAALVHRLRAALTRDVWDAIKPMANTGIGFLTDRDPSKPRVKYEGGRRIELPVEPYSDDELKNAVIEGLFRGANVVGNELNVISGRCYLTKEYFRRKVRQFAGLSNLEISISPPKMEGEQRAICLCQAGWLLEGRRQSFGPVEIAIRVNSGMGYDAILGKAEKKILAGIWRKLTGSEQELPTGDVDEGIVDAEFTSADGARASASTSPAPHATQARQAARAAAADPITARRQEVLRSYSTRPPGITKTQLERALGVKWGETTREQLDGLAAALPDVVSGIGVKDAYYHALNLAREAKEQDTAAPSDGGAARQAREPGDDGPNDEPTPAEEEPPAETTPRDTKRKDLFGGGGSPGSGYYEEGH